MFDPPVKLMAESKFDKQRYVVIDGGGDAYSVFPVGGYAIDVDKLTITVRSHGSKICLHMPNEQAAMETVFALAYPLAHEKKSS